MSPRRHRGAPAVVFTRDIDWHSYVARTSLGKVTLARRPRPKGNPHWGRWLFDLRVEFTDGTVHDEPEVATTARAAKRAAVAAVDARWEESRWPKPRYDDYPDRAPRSASKPMRSLEPRAPDWLKRLTGTPDAADMA